MRIWDISPTDQTVVDPEGRECPVDPMTGEPKVPGSAMTEAPPATGEHEAAQAVGDAWEIVADWRGHVYWTADGERHEITELGIEPPADALDTPPPLPLGDLAEYVRSTIEIARKSAEEDGVTINGIRYSGDPSNRQALAESLSLAKETGQAAFSIWKDSDGRFHSNHPVVDVKRALLAIAERRSELIAHEGDLNAGIDAALEDENRVSLESIQW